MRSARRAFDRFWQSGVARRDGRPNGHFGLGLAIVRELVVGDGGDIALRAVVPHGLAVTVQLRGAEPSSTRPNVSPTHASAGPLGGARSDPDATMPDERQLSTTSG